MPDFISTIATMAEGRAARSTVLAPLLWMFAVGLVGLGGLVVGEGPLWLLILIASIVGLTATIALVIYCRLVFTNPDLLRSERFQIRKMELEQAAMGDDIQGEIEGPSTDQPRRLPPTQLEEGSG